MEPCACANGKIQVYVETLIAPRQATIEASARRFGFYCKMMGQCAGLTSACRISAWHPRPRMPGFALSSKHIAATERCTRIVQTPPRKHLLLPSSLH